MKRIVAITLTCIVILGAVLAGCTAPAAQTPAQKSPTATTAAPPAQKAITLKYAAILPTGHDRLKIQYKYFDQLKTKTNGRITVQPFENNSLVAGKDMLDGVGGSNIADMGEFYAGYFSGTLPIPSAHQVPFIFDDTDHLARVTISPEQEQLYREVFAPFNVLPFKSAQVTMFDLVGTSKWIKVPSDLKGLNVKAAGAMPVAIVKAAGGVPMAVASTDVYENAMRGLLQVAMISTSTLTGYNYWEVLPYYSEIGIYASEIVLGFNKKVYDALPADDRKLLTDTLQAMQVETNQFYTDGVQAGGIYGKLGREKYKYYRPTADEFKLWKDIAAPVAKDFRASLNDRDKTYFDRYLAIIEKYRKKS